MERIEADIARTVFRVALAQPQQPAQAGAPRSPLQPPSAAPVASAARATQVIAGRPNIMAAATRGHGTDASAGRQKLGRNDPCHCGSGKKYKKCHGTG
jgi:preprotein translocase subunit SecA